MGNYTLTTLEVAEILGKDCRTVRRYSDKFLTTILRDGKYFYNKDEVNTFALYLDLKKDDTMRFLYSHIRTGVTLESLKQELKLFKNTSETKFESLRRLAESFNSISEDSLDTILGFYEKGKQIYLSQFELTEEQKNNTVLVEEIASRLRISHRGVVYDLLEEGILEFYIAKKGDKSRTFILFDSFIRYLYPNQNSLFYKSGEVAEIIGVDIKEINRRALEINAGRKIKKGKSSSTYLFTLRDIQRLKRVRRK